MAEAKYDMIEKRIDSFPPLPATVAHVLSVTGNPESSLHDLIQAILPDQSMCVAILKIANSALYGRSEKVGSLETAIMILGFNEVQNIVLGRSVLTAFGDAGKKDKAAIEQFWDHSFTCGLAAKIIAEDLSLSSPGQFFVGGLIHDIGKLAMLLTFTDEYSPALWLPGFSSVERLATEQQSFSVHHGEVGYRLLKHWHFPETLLSAIGYHHSPNAAPKFKGFALLIQLADLLAFLCCNQDLLTDQELFATIPLYLPEFEGLWRAQNLPWDPYTLEAWFAWIKIDRSHGSAILSILAS
jgi:HD-like signal output (HDOD) protein